LDTLFQSYPKNVLVGGTVGSAVGEVFLGAILSLVLKYLCFLDNISHRLGVCSRTSTAVGDSHDKEQSVSITETETRKIIKATKKNLIHKKFKKLNINPKYLIKYI